MITKFVGTALITAVLGSYAASAAEPIGPEEVAKAYVCGAMLKTSTPLAYFWRGRSPRLPCGNKFMYQTSFATFHERKR